MARQGRGVEIIGMPNRASLEEELTSRGKSLILR